MQSVPSSFTAHAQGAVRPLSWQLSISFDKQLDEDITLFTLDTSVLDGPDLLAATEDNPLQMWDQYSYQPYTDRVQMVQWSREIEFPNSVTSAMADFVLENHDDYFTPGAGSSIEEYILPKRPIRILSGFDGVNIPQFVGLTEHMPILAESEKTASFHALDFLSQLYTMPTRELIAAQNVRTHEVVAAILEQFGMTSEQYSLAGSSNEIPFLFFERGANAGEVLRKLMEAEMGNLWLNEEGLVILQPRVVPVQAVSYTFDDSNVIDIKTVDEDQIINKVVIRAEVRAVQPLQSIFAKASSTSQLLVIPADSTYVFDATLQDPVLSAEEPTLGVDSGISWFTATLPDGTEVGSGVSVTASELRMNSYVLTFENTNDFAVNIDQMDIWGEPAKVVDRIEYTEVDQASIDKYGEHELTIDNDFLQSTDQCQALALMILAEFSEYANQIELDAKGHPAIQLGDILQVSARHYDNTYKVTRIINTLQEGQYRQTIGARRHVVREYFILDVSELDSDAQLTP